MASVGLACALAALVAGGLVACGGGGSGSTANAAPASSPPPALPDNDALVRSPSALAASPLDPDWVHGALLQVFVRSYQDSDGDGHGDLRGLIQRLDYIQSLGVRGLWLLPITPSQDGDHGYAVRHYREVESAYGTLADFDTLVREAHARGLGVVLDHVLNHSAVQHPAFQSAAASVASPYRNWYVWQAQLPAGWNVFGANPWRSSATGSYYAPFWDQMPDWNLRETAVVDFHRQALRFWLNRGVDGFRFDAVGLLIENGPNAWENQPENLALLRNLRGEVEAYPRRFMVCEAPSAPAAFAEACGRAFAFGLQGPAVAAAGGRDATALDAWAAQAASPVLSPFLSNHDAFAGERPYDTLQGDTAALKLAAGLNLLRQGTPFVYYGEEIGMGGARSVADDGRLRSPMSWTANPVHAGFSTRPPYRALASNQGSHNVEAQLNDPGSLLHHYRQLLALRNREPVLLKGGQSNAQRQGSALVFWRELGAERLVVVAETGRSATSLSLGGAEPGARYQRLLGPAEAPTTLTADAQGRLALPAAPQSLYVFKRSP